MDTTKSTQRNESAQEKTDSIALPAHLAGSGALLSDARCGPRRRNSWLYIADLAAPQSEGTRKPPALSVASIERHLSGLGWGYSQRGLRLDRKDRLIATVLADTQRKHARPPVQKEAILADDIRAMVATLPHDLRLARSGHPSDQLYRWVAALGNRQPGPAQG